MSVQSAQPSISPSQSAPSGTDAEGADHELLLLQVTDLPPQAAHGARMSAEASLRGDKCGWGWIGLGEAMRPRVPRQGAVSANDATDGQMQCDQKKETDGRCCRRAADWCRFGGFWSGRASQRAVQNHYQQSKQAVGVCLTGV